MKTEVTNFHQSSLYIGLDLHKKQWSVSVYTPTAHHRTFSQPPTPMALKNYLAHHFPGAQVVCAYEACKFGYYTDVVLQGLQPNLPVMSSRPVVMKHLKHLFNDNAQPPESHRGTVGKAKIEKQSEI